MDLWLQDDPETGFDISLHHFDQSFDIRRRCPTTVLNPVRMFRADTSASNSQTLEIALLDIPGGGKAAGNTLERAASLP